MVVGAAAHLNGGTPALARMHREQAERELVRERRRIDTAAAQAVFGALPRRRESEAILRSNAPAACTRPGAEPRR
jgi:hypothetical protein